MMIQRPLLVLTAVLAVLAPRAALAQATTAPAAAPGEARVFLGIDAGYQITSTTFRTVITYPLNVEEAEVASAYQVGPGPFFGVRGGIRVWKSLILGAGLTAFSKGADADVTARLPHPFYLNRDREAAATVTGFDRRETMVAVEASWRIPTGARMDMSVFGGPAFFTASQTTAGEAQYTESYPYDEVTLTDVDRVSGDVSAVGFTVGADVAFLFGRNIGVGALLRYARASGTLDSAGAATVDLGGVQASGGLRIRF